MLKCNVWHIKIIIITKKNVYLKFDYDISKNARKKNRISRNGKGISSFCS